MRGGEPGADDQTEILPSQRLSPVLVLVYLVRDVMEPLLYLVQERAQLEHASREAYNAMGSAATEVNTRRRKAVGANACPAGEVTPG